MAYTKTVWVNDSKPAINADNLNKIELGIEANDAAITENTEAIAENKTAITENTEAIAETKTAITSTTKSYTLSASSWSSGRYTISDALITATSNQEIIPAVGITSDQYTALCAAQLVDGGQTTGSLALTALGAVPTIDIPVRIIYRGVK